MSYHYYYYYFLFVSVHISYIEFESTSFVCQESLFQVHCSSFLQSYHLSFKRPEVLKSDSCKTNYVLGFFCRNFTCGYISYKSWDSLLNNLRLHGCASAVFVCCSVLLNDNVSFSLWLLGLVTDVPPAIIRYIIYCITLPAIYKISSHFLHLKNWLNIYSGKIIIEMCLLNISFLNFSFNFKHPHSIVPYARDGATR